MRNEAIFKLEHLNHYQIITGPCSAVVRVASDARFLTTGNNPRYLVSLNVIEEENIDKVLNRVGDKEYINYSFLKDLFISGAVFKDKVSSIEELPVKGEKVVATFDYVQGVMRCTHVSILPREQLRFVDITRLNKTQRLYSELIKEKSL